MWWRNIARSEVLEVSLTNAIDERLTGSTNSWSGRFGQGDRPYVTYVPTPRALDEPEGDTPEDDGDGDS